MKRHLRSLFNFCFIKFSSKILNDGLKIHDLRQEVEHFSKSYLINFTKKKRVVKPSNFNVLVKYD